MSSKFPVGRRVWRPASDKLATDVADSFARACSPPELHTAASDSVRAAQSSGSGVRVYPLASTHPQQLNGIARSYGVRTFFGSGLAFLRFFTAAIAVVLLDVCDVDRGHVELRCVGRRWKR